MHGTAPQEHRPCFLGLAAPQPKLSLLWICRDPQGHPLVQGTAAVSQQRRRHVVTRGIRFLMNFRAECGQEMQGGFC